MRSVAWSSASPSGVRFSSVHLSLLLALQAADLFLITGTPTPKGDARHETALWRLDTKGELTKTLTLASGNDGLHRLDLVRAEGKAILRTKYPNEKAIVFDLRTQSIAKSCVVPGGFAQWAGGTPLTYQISLTLTELVGFDLSPSMRCEDSIRTLSPAEYVFPVIEGFAGAGDVASQEGFSFRIEKGTVRDGSGTA